MLSSLVQPTGNTASLIQLEHIWRDRAHPANSDTALSTLHFFLKDQEPQSQSDVVEAQKPMPITLKMHAVCRVSCSVSNSLFLLDSYILKCK